MQPAEEGLDASLVYEIFNIYAEWSHGGRVGGIKWGKVRSLMKELDLFEGIPPSFVDAYVREVMLRADQDKDGLLSCQEFFMWFFGELSAHLPFKRNGAPHHTEAPLYNRYVYYCLIDSGMGCRRKATGLTLANFLRMCQDLNISDDVRLLRGGVEVALTKARSNRTLGKMEAGTRLQWPQFLHALEAIAAKKGVGLDAVIYKLVSDGSPPPPLKGGKGGNKAYRLTVLEDAIPRFMESELEAPLRWVSYECTMCGKEHSRWAVANPTIMQAYFRSIGIPYMPHFQHVTGRSVRAVFHRYNIRFNKGPLPPTRQRSGDSSQDNSSSRDQGSGAAAAAGAAESGGGLLGLTEWGVDDFGAGGSSGVRQGSPGRRGAGDNKGDGDEEEDPWPEGWPACCCQYRQMGLMELQTWNKLCSDNRTIRAALQSQESSKSSTAPAGLFSPLTPARIEAAFMACCSIGSVYCSDTSAGIHDKRISSGPLQPAPRSAGVGPHHMARGVSARPASYGTPFDAASTKALAATLSRTRGPGPLSASLSGSPVARPASAHVGPSASGTPWSPAGLRAASLPGSPGTDQHRPATPTLSWPQFLEAIRLVAEDMVGHPQVLVNVEVAMWRILHDLVAVGCPIPAHASLAWGGAPGTGGRSRRRAAPAEPPPMGQSPSPFGGARAWN